MDNLGFTGELIAGIKYGAAAFLLLTGLFAVMRFRRTSTDNEDLSYTTAGATDVNLDDADKFASYISPVGAAPALGHGDVVKTTASDVTSDLLNKVDEKEGGISDNLSLLFDNRSSESTNDVSSATLSSENVHEIQSPEGYRMRLNDTIEGALDLVDESEHPSVTIDSKDDNFNQLRDIDGSDRLAHPDGSGRANGQTEGAGESAGADGATVTDFDPRYLTEQSCEMLKGFIPPEYGEPTLSKAFNDVIIFTSLSNNELYQIYMLSPDLTDKVPLKRKFIQGCRKLATLCTACEPGMLPEFVDLSLEMWPILVCKSNILDMTPKPVNKSWLCPALGKWIIDLSRTVRYIHDNEWAVGRIGLLKEALCDDSGEKVKAVLNRFNFNSTDCLPEAKQKDCAAIKELTKDVLLQVPGKPSLMVIEKLNDVVDAILTKDKRETEKAISSYEKLEASLPCVSG